MKKIFAVISILSLSACWSGGKLDLWPGRSTWLEDLDSYSISYFEQGPRLLDTEYKTIKNYKPNKVLTAYKGYSIADIKTYKKDIYASSAARINMDGGLHSSAAPVKFKKNEQKPVIGTSKIDGNEYYLIPSDLETFVFLINDDGSFYKKMGQVRNGKLVLLDTDYFASPEGLRFEPVTNSTTEQGDPVRGFDLKFDGVKNGKVKFVYFDYASSFGGDNGSFENLSFPNQEGEVRIKSIRVKILRADDQRLDYMIME